MDTVTQDLSQFMTQREHLAMNVSDRGLSPKHRPGRFSMMWWRARPEVPEQDESETMIAWGVLSSCIRVATAGVNDCFTLGLPPLIFCVNIASRS
jgi:hypothetical protein